MIPCSELSFAFLLWQNHNAGERPVRFRVCQLVNKVLNAMGEDVAIDDDLYERIYHAMLQRLRDKLPVVRVQAVLAITRLQDPRDNDCPVINGKNEQLQNERTQRADLLGRGSSLV